MSEDEAQKLLSMYADGLLEEEESRELEAAVEASPRLKRELERLQMLRKSGSFRPVSGRQSTHSSPLSDELLSEALAPLRPSMSGRMRVADAMRAVHAQAQHVANTMPEGKWRMSRLLIVLVSLIVAVLLVWQNSTGAPTVHDQSMLYYYVTTIIYGVGILFTMAGRPLASVEARILGLFSKRDTNPTRLEVLVVEVWGVCSIVVAGLMYLAAM